MVRQAAEPAVGILADAAVEAGPGEVGVEAQITAAAVFQTGPQTTVIRKAPSLGAARNGSLAPYTNVSISCQTEGSSVSGPYGTSTIWDKLGYQKWIPDSYVNTGSDGYVVKPC